MEKSNDGLTEIRELRQAELADQNADFEDLKQIGKDAFLTGVSAFALSWSAHEIGKLVLKGLEFFRKKS